MMEAHESAPEEPTRLSGARADFVATLGRRVEALRAALAELEEEPRSPARRDTLLRRVHAMGAAARVLGFDAVADALGGAEKALSRASAGEVAVADLAEVSRALDLLPSLAWGAGVSLRAPMSRPGAETSPSGPLSLLVFGAAALGEALEEDGDDGGVETERTENPHKARELARVLGPDVIIVDADRRGARELVEGMSSDPLVEPVPLVIVGTFEHPEAASAYVALGVSRVLPKPVSPDTLRRTVLAAARRPRSRSRLEAIGDVTIDDLAARVASEVRRGLVEAVEAGGQRVSVPLGEGTEVFAAVWGAVARLREIVVMRSGGNVRFDPTGPEGAVPLVPWTGGDRRVAERGGGSREDVTVPLRGRTAVVVDDDPAVVWFISGLLKSAGMEVFEAHDGVTALDLVLERAPDVVVSDVLMPGLDGLALCRAIKRDIVVRDVPVILLSWKEDLLQRLRELGADADGYLRKEATGSTVIRRISEALRARARVEARLDAGGEVRGRLDGLTTRLVLQLARDKQPNSRISVRDAVYLYEVELRDGEPKSATRTATDGSFERGEKVLAALLGVSAGRFVVTPSQAGVRGSLGGTLEESLREPIRRARAAARALGPDQLMRVERVEVDREALAAYMTATPEPAARVIERLAEGSSPRDLLLAGETSHELLEAVLADIVRHAAVVRVVSGGEPLVTLPEPKPSPLAAPTPSPAPVRTPAEVMREAEQERLFTFDLGASADSDAIDKGWSGDSEPRIPIAVPRAPEALPLSRTVTPPLARLETESDFGVESGTKPGVGPPSVLQVRPRIVVPKPIVPTPDPLSAALSAPSESVPPVAAPPEKPEPVIVEPAVSEPLPSTDVSPQPIEPELRSEPAGEPEPEARSSAIEAAAAVVEAAEESGVDDEASAEHREQEEEEPMQRSESLAAVLPTQKRIEFPTRRAAPRPPEPEPTPEPELEAEAPRREPAPAEPAQSSRPAPSLKERPMSWVRVALVTAVAAGASFGIVRWVVAPDAPAGEVTAPVATAPTATAAASAPPPAKEAAELSSEDLALPPGVPIAGDKGLLEIDSGGKQAIYVDGTFVGMGPRRRVPLDPGKHEVQLREGGKDKTISVEIKKGRRTLLAAPSAGP